MRGWLAFVLVGEWACRGEGKEQEVKEVGLGFDVEKGT